MAAGDMSTVYKRPIKYEQVHNLVDAQTNAVVGKLQFYTEGLQLKNAAGSWATPTSGRISIVIPDGTIVGSMAKEHSLQTASAPTTFTVDGKTYATLSKTSGAAGIKTRVVRADGTGGLSTFKGNNDPCCGGGGAAGLYSLDETISYTPPTYETLKIMPTVHPTKPSGFRFSTEAMEHQSLDAAAKRDLLLLISAQMYQAILQYELQLNINGGAWHIIHWKQ